MRCAERSKNMKDDIIHFKDDTKVEKLWDELTDVPMNPDTECIEDDFYIWAKGTCREDIWRWFDDHHSRGVYYLLYERQ